MFRKQENGYVCSFIFRKQGKVALVCLAKLKDWVGGGG
jgi:hypothetical protein